LRSYQAVFVKPARLRRGPLMFVGGGHVVVPESASAVPAVVPKVGVFSEGRDAVIHPARGLGPLRGGTEGARGMGSDRPSAIWDKLSNLRSGVAAWGMRPGRAPGVRGGVQR